jgi:DDE superfamily endonuclease
MAAGVGISSSTVGRIWHAFGLQPHRSETFKLSRDPLFIEKVRDIVGLYLSPPDRALVLCVDEKSQIQALDRTQPLLPMQPGMPERRTHDYVRHGTTSLFAALDVKTGSVIADCQPRQRAVEFRKFLDTIEAGSTSSSAFSASSRRSRFAAALIAARRRSSTRSRTSSRSAMRTHGLSSGPNQLIRSSPASADFACGLPIRTREPLPRWRPRRCPPRPPAGRSAPSPARSPLPSPCSRNPGGSGTARRARAADRPLRCDRPWS